MFAQSYLVVIAVTALAGCGSASQSIRSPVMVASPAVSVKPNLPPLEDRLLSRAGAYERKGWLLPEHSRNNAYDLYQSVMLIDPDNVQAKSGLDNILLQEVAKLRRLLARDRITLAQRHLNALKGYYAGSPLLSDFDQVIRDRRTQLAAQAEAVSTNSPDQSSGGPEEIMLNAQAVANKSPEVVVQIQAIAQRLKETDESVLIFANNDAQARWIYSEMRKAVKGYRVRGDIRYAKSVKIRILPPI